MPGVFRYQIGADYTTGDGNIMRELYPDPPEMLSDTVGHPYVSQIVSYFGDASWPFVVFNLTGYSSFGGMSESISALSWNNTSVLMDWTGQSMAVSLSGGHFGDIYRGGDGNDYLSGMGGNDQLTGNGGSDRIDGGTGDDTAFYSGNRADYTITYSRSAEAWIVTDTRGGSPDGTDTVTTVEHLHFADQVVDVPQYVVTTLDDVVDANDGLLSLREAVALANAHANLDASIPDVISFDPSLNGTIHLSGGTLTITDDVIIDGDGKITISGDAAGNDTHHSGSNVTDVAASATAGTLSDNVQVIVATGDLSLDEVTITGGYVTGSSDASGAGVHVDGTLTLSASTVAGNAIALTGNGEAIGGGVYAGTADISGSTINANSVSGHIAEGGGIAGDTLSLVNTTVADNNSVSADGQSSGGGISGTDVTLLSTTVSGNSADTGGGIAADSVGLTNSIVLGNTGGEVAGAITLSGGNIVGGNVYSGTTDVGDTSAAQVFAHLNDHGGGLLADNDGHVETIALNANAVNPALDASDATAPTVDARGNVAFDFAASPDSNGSTRDLGAYEVAHVVVTTLADVVDANDGLISLREAIAITNAAPNASPDTFDTITFDPSLSGTIHLDGGDGAGGVVGGTLNITGPLRIDGDGRIVISGDVAGNDVHVAGSDVTDVSATMTAGTIYDNVQVIRTSATLILDSVTVSGGLLRDWETMGGGGVYAPNSEVRLINASVSGNANITGDGWLSYGGGIYAAAASLVGSTVSGNYSYAQYADGGGIYAGTVTIIDSTVSNNTTTDMYFREARGGGIFGNNITLINATIADNSSNSRYVAGSGGVFANYGTITAVNSTITGNINGGLSGTATLTDSIVMGNTGADIAGTQTLLGTNIVGTSIYSGTTHIGDTTAAAVFAALDTNGGGVLADNGGPVQTVALKLDLTNPAIDAATGSTTPASDARGDARQDLYGFGNDGTHFADLGAYEIVNAPPVLSFANATTSLLENTSTASAIKLADIVETDPDGGPNTLWLSGADADKFEIINGALYLKAGATLDFESDALLSVILNATGPLSAPGAVDSSAAFDLAVGDVNDAATVALTNVHAPISETASTASRIKIADIVVTDVDGGTNVLGLTGDDAGKFEIIGHALYLKAGATLDYETNPTLDVVVTVDDATIPGTPDNSASLSLQVIDELETLTGSIRADRLTGTAGADLIIGNFGNDTINGADGNDQIRGDLGADLLTGGLGADVFIYRSLLDSPATTRGHDVVVDFAEGVDRIDLSAIDASTRKSGNQDFSFVSSFTKHAGEVIYKTVDVAGTANDRTFVYADVNGDGRADFEIELKGLHTLGVGDFIL